MKHKIKEIYNFLNDDTPYYSASLSFFTIFSLFPIIALLIVIISSMSMFENHLNLLTVYIFDFINPTHSQALAQGMNTFLSNTNKLGSIGIFYLLFVFTLFFNNYEDIVNKIYNVPKRAIYKMFFLYIGFFILIPVMFTLFMITLTYLQGYVFAEVISFFFMWFLLIFIFIASPNTKVSFKVAAFGSLITLVTLSFTKTLFTYYVVYNTAYSTIYGSFSVILFFFLWIYISWTIYLYGVKITALLNKYYGKIQR